MNKLLNTVTVKVNGIKVSVKVKTPFGWTV